MLGEAEVTKGKRLHSFDMRVTLEKGKHWIDFGREFFF